MASEYSIPVTVTDDEINEQLNRSDLLCESGKTRGGSYEQGVADAMRWLLGLFSAAPIPEPVEGEEEF